MLDVFDCFLVPFHSVKSYISPNLQNTQEHTASKLSSSEGGNRSALWTKGVKADVQRAAEPVE